MKKISLTFLLWTAFMMVVGGCSVKELPPEEGMVQSEPLAEGMEKTEEEAPEPMFNIPQVEAEVVDSHEPMQIASAEAEVLDTASGISMEETNTTEAEAVAEPAAESEETNTTEAVAEDDNVTENLQADTAAVEPLEKVFEPYEEDFGAFKVKIENASLRFAIKDPIKHHFALENPDRIVLDFKPLSYLEPMQKAIESPAFVSISTASHDQFNRIVIYLREKQGYSINKIEGDWLLTLN